MIAPTHITFAEFFYLLLLTAVGVPLSAAHAAVIAVASVLPDIDTPASTVGRLVPAVSSRLERWYGHRTITHSIVGMAAASLLALPMLAAGPALYVCFVAGYVSHPLLDTMTVTGVKLFHPFSPVRCVFPFDAANPRSYRVSTGSTADKALAAFFAAACLPLFFLSHEGFERAIRVSQGSIEAAVRDYGEFSRSHVVVADVEAANALSGEPVRGRFRVAGAADDHTLLVLGADGALHTLGKAFHAEYVAQDVVCARAAPVQWELRTIDLAGRMVAQIGEEADGADECYLFGTLVLDGDLPPSAETGGFRPVTARGRTLGLNFATAGDLDRSGLADRLILRGTLTLKARYAPGRAPGAASADRFAHLGFAAARGESLTVLVRAGDTVSVGDVIARRGEGDGAAGRIRVAGEALALVAARKAAGAAAAVRNIAIAESTLAAARAALGSARVLVDAGYRPRAALFPMEFGVEKARAARAALSASSERSLRALDLQARRLALQLADLETKRARDGGRSLVRSDVQGVVSSIRRRAVGGKIEVSLIVRRWRAER